MESILDQLERLQGQLKEAEMKRVRLEGQLDSIKTDIKNMGFSSIKEMRKKKESLSSEIIQKELILKNDIESFENEFKHLLNQARRY